jgi:riboflavin synthase
VFTGLVEDVGTVVSMKRRSMGARLRIGTALEGLERGDSIAVNGACQTVVETGRGTFTCDLLSETLRVTNLGGLRAGSLVNLERALEAHGRFGGHFVNGHVDGLGLVTAVSRHPLSLEIKVAPDLFRYLVPKGSVAVDGVSLTVGPEPKKGRFKVFIIPHTWEHTNLRRTRSGSRVNIEVDIIGKYVFKAMHQT